MRASQTTWSFSLQPKKYQKVQRTTQGFYLILRHHCRLSFIICRNLSSPIPEQFSCPRAVDLALPRQFCNIIGSLETQFTTKLPAEHTTPSATHQALNAMASRGAGLYGVFLKGIIDKMDAVPRPIPDSCSHHNWHGHVVKKFNTQALAVISFCEVHLGFGCAIV